MITNVIEDQQKSNDEKNIKQDIKTDNLNKMSRSEKQNSGDNQEKLSALHQLQYLQPKVKIENINIEVMAGGSTQQNSIIVDFDQHECKFTLFDRNKNPLGNFKCLQFIKYLTSTISHNFLSGIDLSNSVNVIETYVCRLTNNNDKLEITLLNQSLSPFMGNIEMILQLYQGIHSYESSMLKGHLEEPLPNGSVLDTKTKKRITAIIKQFAYLLSNHALKLISTITDIIREDVTKKKVKDILLKYSLLFVYNITRYMRDEMENKSERINLIQDELMRVDNLKIGMTSKIQQFEQVLQLQNDKIQKISTMIDAVVMNSMANQSMRKSAKSVKESDSSGLLSGGLSSDSDQHNNNNNTSEQDIAEQNYFCTDSGTSTNINYLTPQLKQRSDRESSHQSSTNKNLPLREIGFMSTSAKKSTNNSSKENISQNVQQKIDSLTSAKKLIEVGFVHPK